jgi:hypothetical protein
MNIAALAIGSSGLVIFLVSLPLACRKAPINPFYGIRIPAAFESNERWYEINAYGGRQMAWWSWLPIVAGATGLFLSPDRLPVFVLLATPLTLVGIAVPLIKVLRWSRRSPGNGSTAARLHELEKLRAHRLISEAEYEFKREEILKGI